MCPQRLGLDESRFVQTGAYDIGKRDINDNIQRHCLICQIFGNPSLASRIEVDDLVCEVDPDNLPEVLRPGVTLNRRRRTAEDQKLYYLDLPGTRLPTSDETPVTGRVASHPCVGGQQISRVGLADLATFQPTISRPGLEFSPAGQSIMTTLQLTIKALSPLAIGRQKPGGSISEAQSYIPGSVIRGAIGQNAEAI